MTDTTVAVPFDAVRRHAVSVEQVSAELTTAHQAANQVYLDTAAFGQLCQFVPGLFDPVLRSAVESITEAASMLTGTSGNLRLAANRAEATDLSVAATVTASGDQAINLPL